VVGGMQVLVEDPGEGDVAVGLGVAAAGLAGGVGAEQVTRASPLD
jgi:hypothetical protein